MAAAATMLKRSGKGMVRRRNERNILTFYEKIAVIRYYEETNISRNSLAKMFHCCATQIRRILERKEALLQQLATLSEADASIIIEEMTRKRRKFEMSAISFILHQWVERCRQLRLRKAITNQTLKETALKMAAILNLPAFRPSYRWLSRFRGKYRYNDEEVGVVPGGEVEESLTGELAVEDIIIEFKDALPSFMQKEISAITSSAKVEEIAESTTHQSSEAPYVFAENSLDYDASVTDDDDDVVEVVLPALTNSAAKQPPGVAEKSSSSEDSLPSTSGGYNSANKQHCWYSSSETTNTETTVLESHVCAATSTVLNGVFPHLAVIHQFALLNSDIKALELISQLGVHMQTQAGAGAYKQLTLATTPHSGRTTDGADGEPNQTHSSTGYFDDIDDIVLIE